jgi:methionine synthase II (cobalamin-independent)
VRRLRTLLRTGRLSRTDYERLVDQQVAFAIGVQEAVGLDVLVHGEPERTDMVEYFGVQLGGLAFTLQVRCSCEYRACGTKDARIYCALCGVLALDSHAHQGTRSACVHE